MNLRANAKFQGGNFTRLEAAIVPRITQAVRAGTQAVLEESQALVPVDTGELKSSGSMEVAVERMKVVGSVQYSAGHAAFVEFGTGARGAASPGAGPVNYSTTWPGMRAQPYIRPAMENRRPEILAAFTDAGFTV